MENIKIPADSMLSREPACSDSSLATRIHLILQNQEALLVPNPDPVCQKLDLSEAWATA